MFRTLLLILVLLFVPYLVISKAQGLKKERQARVRYFIFIFIVILLLVLFMRRI